VAADWKALPDSERQQWEEEARIDKKRYESEMEAVGREGILPKKPMSAFFEYARTRRRLLRTRNPHYTNSDVSKMLSVEWHALPDDERKKYTDLYDGKMAAYKEAMKPFRIRRKRNRKRFLMPSEEATHTPAASPQHASPTADSFAPAPHAFQGLGHAPHPTPMSEELFRVTLGQNERLRLLAELRELQQLQDLQSLSLARPSLSSMLVSLPSSDPYTGLFSRSSIGDLFPPAVGLSALRSSRLGIHNDLLGLSGANLGLGSSALGLSSRSSLGFASSSLDSGRGPYPNSVLSSGIEDSLADPSSSAMPSPQVVSSFPIVDADRWARDEQLLRNRR